MRIGTGQLICLILGVLFISVGGGMLGSRIVAEKSGAAAVQPPATTANGANGAATRDAWPLQSNSESERELKSEIMPVEAETSPAEPPAAAKGVSPGTSEIAAAPAPQPVEEQIAPREETAAPAGKSSSDSGLKYVIQAASTSNQEDARAASKRIMAEGFPARIFEASLPGKGKWFRVYVGPYESEVDALSALEAVRNIPGFSDSFLKEFK